MSEYRIQTDMLIADESHIPLEYPYHLQGQELSLHPDQICIQLHLDDIGEMPRREYLDLNRIQAALGQIAHYIDLRREILGVEHVIGVTHEKVARMAVNRLGFTHMSDIPLEQYDKALVDYMQEEYGSAPNMVFMDSVEFLRRFKMGQPIDQIRARAVMNNLNDQTEFMMPTFS